MKKKECPACAMETDAKNRNCHICGYEFPRQNKSLQWIALLLAIFFLYLIISRVMS
jgi:hypothetical protein